MSTLPGCGSPPGVAGRFLPLAVEGQVRQLSLGDTLCPSEALPSEATYSQSSSPVAEGTGVLPTVAPLRACKEEQRGEAARGPVLPEGRSCPSKTQGGLSKSCHPNSLLTEMAAEMPP